MAGEEYESGSELPVRTESPVHGEIDSTESNSLFGSDDDMGTNDDTAGFVTIKWDDDELTVKNEESPNTAPGNGIGDDVLMAQSGVDAENDLSPLTTKLELPLIDHEPSITNDVPSSTSVEIGIIPSHGPGSSPARQGSSISHIETVADGAEYHPLPYSEVEPSSSPSRDNAAFPRYTSDFSSRTGFVSPADKPVPDAEVSHKPSLQTVSTFSSNTVAVLPIPAYVEDASEVPSTGLSDLDDIPHKAATLESDADDINMPKSLLPKIVTLASLSEPSIPEAHAPVAGILENHPPDAVTPDYSPQVCVQNALAASNNLPSEIPCAVDGSEARTSQDDGSNSHTSDFGLPYNTENNQSTHSQFVASLVTSHPNNHHSHYVDPITQLSHGSSTTIASTDVIVGEDLVIQSASMSVPSQNLPAAGEDSGANKSVTDESRLDYYTHIKQMDIELVANFLGNLQTVVDNATRFSEELRDEVLIRSENSVPTAWSVERLHGSIQVAEAIYAQVDDTKDVLSRSYGYGGDIHDRVKESLKIDEYGVEVIDILEDAEEQIRDAMRIHQHAKAVLEESGALLSLVAEESNNKPEKNDDEDQTITEDQDQESVVKVETTSPVRPTTERPSFQGSTENPSVGEVMEHPSAQESRDHAPRDPTPKKRRYGESCYTTRKGTDGQVIRTLRPPKRHRTLGRVETY
ncbi:hypothetical protein F5Y18DRAFT_422187 [Xylariaceae sp. FL1019]|nr:hypothetical protein F5Y18DRAFT_422187 [Xylariaceae sp. FL1019]